MGIFSKKRTKSDNEQTLWKRLRWLFFLVALLWVIELIDQMIPGFHLDRLGVYPRRTEGLFGIFFSSFLHVNFNHLAANTIPFTFFAALILLRGKSYFIRVTFSLMIIEGLITWCFARKGFHLGASGIIFGYFGFLMTQAIFERSLSSILVAFVVGSTYGGLFFTIFPSSGNYQVSWEGHLGGFLAGIWLAYSYAKKESA